MLSFSPPLRPFHPPKAASFPFLRCHLECHLSGEAPPDTSSSAALSRHPSDPLLHRRASAPENRPWGTSNSRLRPVGTEACQRQKLESYTSTYFKNSPSKQIFSHLRLACFAYSTKLHPHPLTIDKLAQACGSKTPSCYQCLASSGPEASARLLGATTGIPKPRRWSPSPQGVPFWMWDPHHKPQARPYYERLHLLGDRVRHRPTELVVCTTSRGHTSFLDEPQIP